MATRRCLEGTAAVSGVDELERRQIIGDEGTAEARMKPAS
jgi:hypothetical protein